MKPQFWLAWIGLFGIAPALASSSSSDPQRAAAALAAAAHDPTCSRIAPFYWEIGDGTRVLASGSTGDGSVNRGTEMAIASASKWVFGAYVVQRLGGKIDAVTQKYLEMMAGYTHLSPASCIMTRTIQDCFNHGDNSGYTKENDGVFFYNGGHFQKWAVDHGLGSFDRQQMADEYQKQLGKDLPVRFGAFQLAGGLNTSAQGYAVFLQKVLSGKLLLRQFLGANPICTLPAKCAQAARSPIPLAWHYSFGHWVEDDPEGDGAFSSAGAFGFYPWIDKTKTYYGIIARRQRGRSGGEGAGLGSAKCGRAIRQAFLGK